MAALLLSYNDSSDAMSSYTALISELTIAALADKEAEQHMIIEINTHKNFFIINLQIQSVIILHMAY